MALAIFGITNSGLNLAATLVLLLLVVVWLALIVYTFLDARRRIGDPFLVACATIASLFPYIGTIIYTIVRPPEFLEDAHERELEIKAAELRVRHLREESCPNCEYPVEKNYLRCPNCQRRLKDPCPTCAEPVDPRWSLCPYCETALAGGERSPQPRRRGRRPEEERERERDRELEETGAERRRPRSTAKKKRDSASSAATAEADTPTPAPRSKSSGSRKQGSARSASSKEAPTTEPKQRSPRREPDPDPRQA